MITISKMKITATSLVSKADLQKVVLQYDCSEAAHLFLSVYRGEVAVVTQMPIVFSSGCGECDVMLPVQGESFDALWEISDKGGNVLYQNVSHWKRPREWTIYAMVSSHTDIGLHNSQYIQRYTSSKFVDEAVGLCDATDGREPCDRYRYTMEGTWFWNNYGMDRGKEAADRIVKDYIHPGKIGVCAGIAGNHFQTFGLEEMCRSTYVREKLKRDWSVSSSTLAMIDNNGLPMSMIQPYAEAGYKNIIFAPNQWNPLNSTVWRLDKSVPGYTWNPEAGGGGARVDVRYDSELPMVFNWEDSAGNALTVWASTQYDWGGASFGFFPSKSRGAGMPEPKDTMWKTLEKMEKKYPFDIWLLACYEDDQTPDIWFCDQIKNWNAEWKWPRLRTLGNPDEPFELLRERFGDRIPVLRGDMTGGWYQHPLTVPELMAKKFDADRTLPNAEKWATVAGMLDEEYAYPATDFDRAWDCLLLNDEHSYGTSGYQGRRVYETWMQHRDWIDKALTTAIREEKLALETIASHIAVDEESVVAFNPTAQVRTERISSDDGSAQALVTVPAFGYRAVPLSHMTPVEQVRTATETPPTVENSYYKITFSGNGSICSIYDKELGRELLDLDNQYHANELIYTKDNHKSFMVSSEASFELCWEKECIRVIIRTQIPDLKADILQTVTLPRHEKRIDIDNKLYHVRDMVNRNRYYRYLYYAFPFGVENCRRICHLNGAVAEYGKDVTGHGTDVYMAVNEWCCAENDRFGVALMMKDAHLIEFDHIHPDKTDFGDPGEGSQVFSYVANDWLQMHAPGGSHLDYRFRYSISSYSGGYQTAKIPQMAERYVNPLTTVRMNALQGDLPKEQHSFMELDPELRFLCLKRADDGKGIIARFYGESNGVRFSPALHAEPSTVDERPGAECTKKGFITYRLGKESMRIKTREPAASVAQNGQPAPIGAVYTGLITKPCAAAGEHNGHLYLLWGANTEEDFCHYKLYRSECPGFEPCEETFVADIYPEEYVVGRFDDRGLKDHTCYYYRVCAVNKQGVCGAMSEEFSAYTREVLTDTEGEGQR